MQRYTLAKLRDRVPMPERGPNVFFTDEPAGESVDPMNPFYARMITDGDLVAVDEDAPAAEPIAEAPAPIAVEPVTRPAPTAETMPAGRLRKGD